MATKYTIQDALAYIAVTGDRRGLHIGTRIELHEFVVFRDIDTVLDEVKSTGERARWYELNSSGEERARKSRLWKAHCQLAEMGFTPAAHRPHKPGFILYTHKTDGGRTAFTGKHGRAYAEMSFREDKGYWTGMEQVGAHRNG